MFSEERAGWGGVYSAQLIGDNPSRNRGGVKLLAKEMGGSLCVLPFGGVDRVVPSSYGGSIPVGSMGRSCF